MTSVEQQHIRWVTVVVSKVPYASSMVAGLLFKHEKEGRVASCWLQAGVVGHAYGSNMIFHCGQHAQESPV